MEIYNDEPNSLSAIQELRNDAGTLSTRKLQNNPENQQQNVDSPADRHVVKKRRDDESMEDHDSPADRHVVKKRRDDESTEDHVVKKQRDDESMECLFDWLPSDILHDILSWLSITDLLIVARTCVAWSRIVWSCKDF